MNLFEQKNNSKERAFEKFKLKDGEVWLMSNFMPPDKAKFYYDTLKATINWRQEEIKMYGKRYPELPKSAWNRFARVL